MKRLTIIPIIIILALCSGRAAAQDESYKFDFGAGLGMSGYLGDANESFMYRHPGFAADLEFRYLFEDNRWAIRTQVGMQTISGNTAEWTNALPDGASYDFKSSVYDLQVRGEFNFFPYGIGETYKRLRRWTPYLSVGVGGCMAIYDGSATAGFCIPMGFGFKFKLKKRLNLTVEFSMIKSFSDKLDSAQLSDLYQIKSSFLKNTDWYSTLNVGLSYEFGARCSTCHRID